MPLQKQTFLNPVGFQGLEGISATKTALRPPL
jgi:hypothetical protein